MLKLIKMHFFKKHLLFCSFLGILIFSISVFIIYSTNMPIRNIGIYGDLKYIDQKCIKKVVLPWVNTKIYNVKISEIYNELMALPWVSEIDIGIRWPNRLLISIVEKRPVAIWNSHWLFEQNGKLFFPEYVPNINIPKLEGPVGKNSLVFEHFYDINNLLAKKGLELVSIKMHLRKTITISLANGISIKLGRQDPITRLSRFLKLYDDIMAVGQKDAEVVDLRYPKGFAVRRKK